MSRKKHRASEKAPATSSVPVTTSAQAQIGSAGGPFLLFGNGFQAADNSPNRGYLYWPSTDTFRQITPLTRNEIARRVQWLCAHFGFARKLIKGMARMLGFQTPQPNVSDEEWNEEAFDSLINIFTSAEIWDQQGKFDQFQAQIADNEMTFREGDGIGVFTETSSGRPRMAYYEAHQISNGEKSDPWWIDGVRLDRFNKHIGYNLRDGQDTTKFFEVDARDALYFGNFENRGQTRPLSILHAAVLNMIDIVETRGSTKTRIKDHARLGTVVEKEMGAPSGTGTGGFGGPVRTVTATMPDGTEQKLSFEFVTAGIQAPRLNPGEKIKVVADDRPSPNNMEFERALMRDCCDSVDLSFERFCYLAGITGPGLRLLNADDKRWVAIRHYAQAKRNNRQAVYALAKEMKAGRLRQPKLKPGEFWWNKIEWIGMPHPDIDGGRTAQATLTDLRSGLTTWLDEWGEQQGVYWKRRVRQSIVEYIYARLECMKQAVAAGLAPETVTPEIVFPERWAPATGAQLIAIDPRKTSQTADVSDPADTPSPAD